MSPMFGELTLQFIALSLAAFELVLALYVLLLNTRHVSNRHTAALLLVGASTSFAQGMFIGAADAAAAEWPALVLSAMVATVTPLQFIVSVAIVKPDWLPSLSGLRQRGWLRLLWLPLYLLAILPPVLTAYDVMTGAGMFYVPLDPAAYAGGLISSGELTIGRLADLIELVNYQIVPPVEILFLLYVALRDRRASRLTRRFAWLLVGQLVLITVIQLGLRGLLPLPLGDLLVTVIFALTYSFAIFQQMVSERRAHRGQLRPRLTALVLVVVIPLIIAIPTLFTLQARADSEQVSTERLADDTQALSTNTSLWLRFNIQALRSLVALPSVISMQASQQTPALEAMVAAHPHLRLVTTVDLDGDSVARSDGQTQTDYGDEAWFRQARAGMSLSYQMVANRDSGRPALVISAPIRDVNNQIVGVGMITHDLGDLAQQYGASQSGETGFAYLVDSEDRLIMHSDPALLAESGLADLSAARPLSALRQGGHGLTRFTQENQSWLAFADELDNGWGIVTQTAVASMVGVDSSYMTLAVTLSASSIIMISVMTWITISQAIRPIAKLTETASSIASGDLTAKAPVEGEDEIGLLARAFNSMTDQLQALIAGLEARVAERTQELEARSADLEQRSLMLQTASGVARAAASILDPDQLMAETVNLIQSRFDLYYVGLFLVEPAGELALLRAGTGEAGQAMIARDHRIRVGDGMIGWCIANASSRIAQIAEEDAIRLTAPELPATRAEAAIPLRSRDRTIGALTIQDTRADAFDQEMIGIFQVMADQVAVALENARLYGEAQASVEVQRRAFGELTRQAWAKIIDEQPNLAFRSDSRGLTSAKDYWPEWMEQATATDQVIRQEVRVGYTDAEQDTRNTLALPIRVQDHVIAVLDSYKPAEAGAWADHEVALMENVADQLAMALENARLHQETRLRAEREQVVGEISAKIRAAGDIDGILRTAVHEVRRSLGISHAAIRLGTETHMHPQAGQEQGVGAAQVNIKGTGNGQDHHS